MKKTIDIYFSMLTSIILMLIFGASIAYATFAESSSGTEYAKAMVYNAKWFEVLLVLLIINLSGSIFRYNLINRRKWSVLLFHLAFICMIIGAAITRYTGFEGIMHIRQGETSNEISSDKTSVGITAEYKGQKIEKTTEAAFSENGSNTFSESLKIGGKTITVENELFVPNSMETIVPDEQGTPALSLFAMNSQNQSSEFILMKGETNQFEDVSFAFDDTTHLANISFSVVDNQVSFKSTVPVAKMEMMEKNETVIAPGINIIALEKTIYKAGNVIFVMRTFLPKATRTLTQAPLTNNKTGIVRKGKDAVIFKVSDGNIAKKINVLSSSNQISQPSSCNLNDIKVSVEYGMLQRKLPFSLTLRAFQLDRYAGSNSPSSYASEITVTDKEMKSERPFRIFMNNILNYRGYRFFQSSYDQDERGTILSVSHDYWGTMISYLGYLLMTIGMIWTLLNKNSRFRTVLKLSNDLQKKRKVSKVILLAAFMILSNSIFVSGAETTKASHIKALSGLLIQDEAQGRIEPFSTYASDVLRKIHKKPSYKNMSPVEVLLGMSANPSSWQNEPIIKVGDPQLAKELGVSSEYVSYVQLFDYSNGGVYKLKDLVEKTYQKDPSAQSKYDKEVIYVDERVNICTQIFSHNLLAFFPVPGNDNSKWSTGAALMNSFDHNHGTMGMSSMENMNEMSAVDADSLKSTDGKTCPYLDSTATGAASMKPEINSTSSNGKTCPYVNSNGTSMPAGINGILTNDSPEMLLTSYYKCVNEAIANNNWSLANDQLNRIKSYQIKNGGNNLPSNTKINLEISYNNLNIFGLLSYVYTLLGLILLTLHLIDIFKKNAGLDKYLKYAIYPFALTFIIYTAGLAVRWYISNHAPWSNGYETMIFVGWAAALSGLVFSRRSPISLAVTGILSAIALIVAAMSWMNPEITNLVPVLKSYWLIIHVAIITTSYGFLAMGALLGALNLGLMISRTKENLLRLKDSIQEISYIIELSLIVGLILLTIGCFIGGVWANESWGRYWGWDPKETWALVSILVYASLLHLRNIPKLNNQFILSSLALISFSTIIMTFFGVNYYLSGMHSYAQGTAPAIPTIVYFVIVGIIALVIFAYNSEKKYKKK
jgi:cytochrome c-type biogenesis protein CcsB